MRKKINIINWFLVLILVGFFAFSFFGKIPEISQEKIGEVTQVSLAGATLNTEIANTIEARIQGLSHRPLLGEENSMLFVFDEPGVYPFWMKDMNFPIDIIWIGEDKRVVHIEENASPDSYPRLYEPMEDAKYVLETEAGFADKNNLKIGDKVNFENQ